MGTLTMELGGKVSIDCDKTGYRTEIEFKLKVCKYYYDNSYGYVDRLNLNCQWL